ncbi:hypothetical protein Bhyg_13744 [Pseudolycoriella hygida]|uniref:Uncharacterized protein n=1 Tax=Pseudolycoriella hygida TaxID=35572 RepID=A0A9Q0MNX8_9DIPT|nr:hypothetical protein Bhyg_13744 [Pseudolycoriella hygida]
MFHITMADVRTEAPHEDLPWTKLLNGKNTVAPVIITVDDEPIKTHLTIPPTSSQPSMGSRIPSFLDNFNRSLRSSFKAVTDSPGPISR